MDVQAFHRDEPVATDQFQCGLEVMFAPLVGDVSMQNTDDLDSLASIFSALFLTADRVLCATQSGKLLLEKAWIIDHFSVRGGQEVFEAHVDADSWKGAGLDRNSTEVTGQDDEPLIPFQFQGSSLHDAFDLTVDLAPDDAHVLYAKAVPVQPDTISVGRELDAIEAATCFEAWVAGGLSNFDTAEECNVRLVEVAHRGLRRGKVESREVDIIGAQIFELSRLVAVLHRVTMLLIEVATLFQTKIVESTMRFKHDLQLALLVGVGEQPKFECLTHVLFTLLSFDIMPDARFGNSTTRPSVVTTAPKRWQTRTQRRKLRAQVMRRAALEAGYQLSHASGRVGLNEEVYVVGHDLERVNRHINLCGNGVKQNDKAFFNIVNKDGSTVLRAPHEVVLEGEYRAAILSVLTHAKHYKHAYKLVNKKERGAAIPLSAKADSPLAA